MVAIEILTFALDAESVIFLFIFIAQITSVFYIMRHARGNMKDLLERYEKMSARAEVAFSFIRERGLADDFEEYLENLIEDLSEKYGDERAEL